MHYSYVIYGLLISILLIGKYSCFARIIRRNSVEYEKIGFTGSDIELSCELTNYYGSDVLWRKVEGRMSDESEEYGGRLIIKELKKEDAGEYECYLSSGQTSRVRLMVNIDENQRASSHHQTNSNEVNKEIDGNVELTCQISDKDNLRWRKLNGRLSEYSREYGNKLLIYFLKEEDSGVYECYLPNGQSSRVRLNVGNSQINHDTHDEDEDQYENNRIKSENRDSNEQYDDSNVGEPALPRIKYEYNVEKGVDSNVELTCAIASEYGDDVKWRKIDGRIGEYAREHGNKLYIYYLKEEDAGEYECYLPNGQSNRVRLAVLKNNQEEPSNTRGGNYYLDSHDETRVSNNENSNEQTQPQVEETNFQPIVEKEVDENAELVCGLSGDELTWKKIGGSLNEYSRPYDNKLLLYYLKEEDAGDYECSLPDGRSNRVRLVVRNTKNNEHREEHDTRRQDEQHQPEHNNNHNDNNYNHQRQPEYYPNHNQQHQGQRKVCEIDQATCRNGQCISRSGLCDGKNDCADGSDENNCGGYPSSNACQPNEKSCRNGKCIQKIWFCDGEKDCEDGSDEESCSPAKPGEMCKSTEFQCKSRNQCILKSFQCDKEFDCVDKSDEIGCEQPRITVVPIRTITSCLGETFKIECHAEGFPVPFINWRLNWGHVCDEPRCFSTNENGRGILTVTDARYTDQGAYSCEAINSQGRVFAVPDTIVTINDCVPAPVEQSDCFCHNHSIDCTCSGKCINCEHNTYGDKCQYCKEGYIGDATRGTPFDCVPNVSTTQAPEPLVENDCLCNNHSTECTCSGACLRCQHNTKGINCELCADGYVGDAKKGTPYDCQPIGSIQHLTGEIKYAPKVNECNPHGTAKVIENICKCKYGVTGTYCDKCAPRSFHLITNRQYKRGCLSCFCNGLDVNCESSSLFYNKVEAVLENEGSEWKISDRFTELSEAVEIVDGGIEFNRFDDFRDKELYFIAPDKFKENKLKSYGGNITFNIKFTDQDSTDDVKNVEIRISGSQINIYHSVKKEIQPNTETTVVIPLYEDEFKRYGDDGKVDRDHLMMALSKINLFMIRATYTSTQSSIRLSDFSMDVADKDNAFSSERALYVEECSCPAGYTGTSCETCAPGYLRSNRGFYLGLCEPLVEAQRY